MPDDVIDDDRTAPSGGVGLEAPVEYEERLDFFVRAFQPEHREDPYPLYRSERERSSMLDAGSGLWFAFGYAECSAALRSPVMSSDERRSTIFQQLAVDDERLAAMRDETPMLLFMDPPDHTRLRSLVGKAFTPTTVERLRGRIDVLTTELIDALRERSGEPVDIVSSLAYPLPVTVICELLGVPVADHEVFAGWSTDLAHTVDPGVLRTPEVDARIAVAQAELSAYTEQLLAERRRHPHDDLLSGLLAAQDGDERLSTAELVQLVLLLLVAGHETTVNLISNGVLALLRSPDQCALLRGDPSLDRTAVDELLRYDSPVQMVQRVATEPIRIGDAQLAVGDQIIPILGAANRDPAMFADPDRVDLRRPNASRNLAFGGGIHHCLGMALARTEGIAAIGALVRAFPQMQFAGEPVLRPSFTLRGRDELTVSLR